MSISKQELSKHDKMAEILPQLIDDYFINKNINAVSISLKIVNGKLTDKLSFMFGVKEKLALNLCSTPIPSTIIGYPTDVVEFDILSNERKFENFPVESVRNEKTDPLIGGISISPDEELEEGGKKIKTRGTLGAMILKKGDDRPYMITCGHVLAGVGTKLQTQVCQQSKWETTLDYCHNCAELKAFYHENVSYLRESKSIESWLDCAIARKGWFRNTSIGKLYGVDKTVSGFIPSINSSLINKEVCKSGIKTDVTRGLISSITLNAKLKNFDGTEVIAKNLIQVFGNSGAFSLSGDSGAVVFLTENLLMIGLVCAGDGTMSAITPSDAILSKWPELSFIEN
jgi:hypothetical protein